MSLLVVGTVAIDCVVTPRNEVSETLGGSAAYFSCAASYFHPVRLVTIVGDDFPPQYLDFLQSQPNIDTSGLRVEPGKSFRWKGKYSSNMNHRETLEVQLNVFGRFDPDVPDNFRDSQYVFLGNGSPVVQRKVLGQVVNPKLVVADTMDFWIETQRPELIDLLGQLDGIVLNEDEALLLTREEFVVRAGQAVLAMGPKFVIVKRGEHGAMFFSKHGIFSMPAYPIANVVDPTGAGDSFAGGLMGYLACCDNVEPPHFKRGMAFGTVVASFVCEDFSLNRFQEVRRPDIDRRFDQYREMLHVS